MPTALFVFSIYHYHREMAPVAVAFRKAGWRVHMLIGWAGPTAKAAEQDARAVGIEVGHVPSALNFGDHLAAAAIAASGVDARSVPGRDTRAGGRPRFHTLKRFYTAARYWRRCGRAKRYARFVLDDLSPDVVFGGPWQAAGTFDNGFALWCNRKKTPYCCLSFSPYMGERNNIGGRFLHLEHGMASAVIQSNYDRINRFLARLFPRWTRTRDGVAIFYWDPLNIFAAWLRGMAERNIWQRPSERYDVVFVFSEFSRRMMIESGYDDGKIVVAGMPLLDRIVEAGADPGARRAFYDGLGLRENEPFLIWNIEPTIEHRYGSSEDHWRRIDEQRAALKRTGLRVVLSLHPLCRYEDYRFLEADPTFVIARTTIIHELYPYCTAVLSHPCSTNLLAEQFGKPLVIVDYSRMTDPASPRADLYRLPGASIAYSGAELEDRLRSTLETAGKMPPPVAAGGACRQIIDSVTRRFGPGRPTAGRRSWRFRSA